MSEYAWVGDRKLNTYMANFNSHELDYYMKEIKRHQERDFRGAECPIVKMARRVIGFRIRITWGWPKETSFWPKVRKCTGLEMFLCLWQVEWETCEFMDTIYYDPMGEWPKGTKIKDIEKKIEAAKKEALRGNHH